MDTDKWQEEVGDSTNDSPRSPTEECSRENSEMTLNSNSSKTGTEEHNSEQNLEANTFGIHLNNNIHNYTLKDTNDETQIHSFHQRKSKFELSSSCSSSKEDIGKKAHMIKFPYGKPRFIGNLETEDKMVRSVYITTCNPIDDIRKTTSVVTLEKAIKRIVTGKVKLRETPCGIIASFNKEEDCERTTKLNMSRIFGGPIAVWNIPQVITKYRKCVLIKDIPWCVPIKEVESLLKCQGIQPLCLSRGEGSSIRVEVKNTSSLERFLTNGLNFFNCTTLPVVLEPTEEIDVVQCYKCQRFWHTAAHCPYHVRCVRCGERHDVRECIRPRKNPVCCLCGESHHAAYKLCAIRLQHLNSVQVEFAMCKEPVRRE